jgi:hypothetical protein
MIMVFMTYFICAGLVLGVIPSQRIPVCINAKRFPKGTQRAQTDIAKSRWESGNHLLHTVVIATT